MIKEINIKNYALLDEARIDFNKGFNVLTGSTGTGKSIIINALSLLLGEKGDVTSIRKRENKATVEGVFSGSKSLNSLLKSYGLPVDNNLIIKRNINRKGGGSVYINGSIANLRILKDIGEVLFDIHGQHEHQLLINEDTHIDFLDSYGELTEQRKDLTDLYHRIKSLESKLKKKTDELDDIIQKKELYEYQKKELESLKLNPNDYEKLKEEKKVLDNFEEISMIIESSIKLLNESDNSILNLLSEINENLKKVSDFDKRIKSLSNRINESNLLLQDSSLDLTRYRDTLDYDKERLIKLEEIVDNVEQLKKKFKCNYQELLDLKEELSDKIFNIKNLTQEIESVKETINEESKKLELIADSLSKERVDISSEFAKKVEVELKDLGFEDAHFKVEIKVKEEIGEKGKDRIRFLFEPNIGEGWNKLSKIASGGELSRVMLALKSILSEVDRVEGLVFDEIDVGIGGSLAQKIGKKMKVIGNNRQVLCVTHLPNIASEADFHIKVDKKTLKGRTTTNVKLVEGEERVEEIARMLSGDSSRKTAIKHAKELLSR